MQPSNCNIVTGWGAAPGLVMVLRSPCTAHLALQRETARFGAGMAVQQPRLAYNKPEGDRLLAGQVLALQSYAYHLRSPATPPVQSRTGSAMRGLRVLRPPAGCVSATAWWLCSQVVLQRGGQRCHCTICWWR